MEENDAQPARSGISAELLKEITAQFATLSSATKLINQHHQESKNNNESNNAYGEWVYNMKDLGYWLHHYTERRKLHCPNCKEDQIFNCDCCGNEFEYHDEL
jgi:hypothetical protein